MKNNIYTTENRIRFSEIDHTKKITIPGIINYFQDCSIYHSEEVGLGFEYLEEHKRAWILSSWLIDIHRYPVMGENIRVSTWATEFKGIFGNRNFCMWDEAGEITACANSLWVYMDIEKGRPTKPNQMEMDAYGTSEPLEMEAVSRKIELPEKMKELASFPVKRYHIDTNEHVNNCQYVQMAQEALDREMPVKRVRAEYKKSAVYKDIIVPKVGIEADRTVVELCDEAGKAYAVVEFV